MSALEIIKYETIYHYTTNIGLFGILKSRNLHLSNIDYMNDPNEMKYLNRYLQSYKERNYIPKDAVKNILKEVDRIKCYYDVFVFSTSSDKDSHTLWKSYSRHENYGYNIGLNIEKLRKILKKNEIIEANSNNIMFVEDGEVIYSESKK